MPDERLFDAGTSEAVVRDTGLARLASRFFSVVARCVADLSRLWQGLLNGKPHSDPGFADSWTPVLLTPAVLFCLSAIVLVNAPLLSHAQEFTNGDVLMIERPKTIKDLMNNIKYAMEHSLFMQKDFYEHEKLAFVFSARHENIWSNSPSEARVIVDEFGKGDGSDDISRVHLSAGCMVCSEKKMTAGANFTIRSAGPSFDEVIDVFGSGWERELSPPSSHSRPFADVTAHSNERIKYLFDLPTTRWSVTIAFDQTGRASDVVISGASK